MAASRLGQPDSRPREVFVQWRLAALAGATAGLALAPFASLADPALGSLLVAAAAALMLARPRAGAQPSTGPRSSGAVAVLWLALVALTACGAGLTLGGVRVGAIDAAAFDRLAERPVTATGFVTAVPRRSRGVVSVRVETADGRLLVEAPEPVPELRVGREVRASGTLREAESWQAGYLRVHGIALVLEAERIELTGARRGGLAGLSDRVRDRAEVALERGMPPDQAALARGFVLGQDDRIDPETVDEFKRSGLAHLLAVSGQNVVLLGLLAVPLLAALNLSLRARLVCVLVLIAIYVPVTGAGPSIQRAAVMGAAGIAAVLAGRPRSRWYALLLAALVTLALNPRAAADVGWQLSFAAVAGILLWAGVIRDLLPDARAAGRAIAEGAALTIAATLATAPLMAHHFEAVSAAALPANLLALPAVAPVMWLGMLAAMLGQTAIPVEPLNAVCAPLIAYIALVAHLLGSPGWAQLEVGLSPAGVVATYAALLLAGIVASRWARRRHALGLGTPRRWALGVALVAAVAVIAIAVAGRTATGPVSHETAALEVSVLDVGQGDAILLEPGGSDPVLVDAGPPGAGIAELLAAEGVERLDALVITHDQLDHAGGAPEVLESVPVGTLAFATPVPALAAHAEALGARTQRLAAPGRMRSGRLRLDALWPPRELVASESAPPPGGDEVNRLSLVTLVRLGEFSMLLTGDAEAEAAPIHPGAVDVLKVAHHGSQDAGLGELLDRSLPALAVISVGEGNPYGHPAEPTLAELDARGVPVMRTDVAGEVEIDADAAGWTARTGIG